jgi:hypothetical protein
MSFENDIGIFAPVDDGVRLSRQARRRPDGVASMPDYRLYKIKNNHIAGVPVVFTCDSDQDAIQQAKKLVDGHDVELWEGPRFVIGIKSGDDT